MKFTPDEIPDRLAAMLRRAGRADLIAGGFDLDDATLERSMRLHPRDRSHAVYHALFDPAAPHARTIKPVVTTEPPSFFSFRGLTFRLPNERGIARWLQIAILLAILAALFATRAHAQSQPPTGGPTSPLIIRGSNGATTLATRHAGLVNLKCDGITIICSWSAPSSSLTLGIGANVFSAGLQLTNATFALARSYNIGTGDVDIYTAPAAKRALIEFIGGFNPSAGIINWYPEIKSGGSYYRIAAAIAAGANSAAGSAAAGIILEPGETLSVHTDGTGLNLSASAIQFDSTSPLRTVKLTGMSTGDNTLYTVPTGKTALVLAANPFITNAASVVPVVADSGGARIVNICAVPFGGSTACASNAATEIAGQSVTASTRANVAAGGLTMAAGDFLVVDIAAGAATQLAWVNVLEF